MKRFIMLLLFILTFFKSSPTYADRRAGAQRHVLIVGDSEACAVAPYVKRVVHDLGADDDVSVSCKGGTMVQYWGEQGHLAEALVFDLATHPKPDIIIVFLGTNHWWEGHKALSMLPTRVKPILDLIRSSGASCVWVGNTAVHGHRWSVNSIMRDAVTPQCTYFDTENAGIQLADGVHPTSAGAISWLTAVWRMLP